MKHTMARRFIYIARNSEGKVVRGTVEGEDELVAANLLRRKKLFVLKLRPVNNFTAGPAGVKPAGFLQKKASLHELAVFSRQFATMVETGIPLLQSLVILSRQTENRLLKNALVKIIESLKSGRSLAGALRAHPGIFPVLFVNMVEVGETGGALDAVLLRLADYFEKASAFREKLKSALAYPAVVAAVTFTAVAVMLVFVLPAFAAVLSDMGAAVPVPTRLVLGLGGFMRRFWYVTIILVPGLLLTFKTLVKSPSGKENFDRLVLRLPLYGPLLRRAILSRFSQTLSILLASGVPLLTALEVAKSTCGNLAFAAGIDEAEKSIREGSGIAEPLERCGMFPPMLTRMIAVGEETGALDTLLQKAAVYYEREVEATVDRLTALVEPVLILGAGLLVGLVILSVMLPLFSITAAIE